MISEQRERWLAAGSPPVPTLVVDGVPHVLQHPSQAALLLGFEPPPALRDAWQVAWDVDEIVEAWLAVAQATRWDALLEPVPGLARTPLASPAGRWIRSATPSPTLRTASWTR